VGVKRREMAESRCGSLSRLPISRKLYLVGGVRLA
jgi:hypothetical protein